MLNDPDTVIKPVQPTTHQQPNYVNELFLKICNSTAFFIIVYIIAWALNGTHPNYHFDLGSLMEFYLAVIGKQSVEHTVNSVFNSNRGEMPVNIARR